MFGMKGTEAPPIGKLDIGDSKGGRSVALKQGTPDSRESTFEVADENLLRFFKVCKVVMRFVRIPKIERYALD